MKHKLTWRRGLIHLGLFVLAWATTMMAGAEFATGKIWFVEGMDIDFWKGLPYSIAFLAFLTVHEFGHYLTALYHNVKTTLPYYIPLYIPFSGFNIGSLGAVIMLRQVPDSTRKFFDIGIAGPLAGFVVSLILLTYGFTHLPPLEETVFTLHPEYEEVFGHVPSEVEMNDWLKTELVNQSVAVGTNLLFEWMAKTLPSDPSQVPPAHELMHYPFLFVGFITLFFTALNLLPIGQLDGGHVVYGLFGRKNAGIIARIAAVVLLLLGGTGLVEIRDIDSSNMLDMGIYALFVIFVFTHIFSKEEWQKVSIAALSLFLVQMALKWFYPSIESNPLWLLYTLLAVRMIKLDHPKALFEHKLSPGRKALGWLSIVIFILCFTLQPLRIIGETDVELIEQEMERRLKEQGDTPEEPKEAPKEDALPGYVQL